jgi:hypothetical protein
MASMLEYIKIILQKVSFDHLLFEKELRKAIRMLMPDENKKLRLWCYERFSSLHQPILDKVFALRTSAY